MKIYCKRTFFDNDKLVLCKKNNIYEAYLPTDFESNLGICFWVQTELPETSNLIARDNRHPLTLKCFEKYFTTLDDIRNIKINKIIK